MQVILVYAVNLKPRSSVEGLIQGKLLSSVCSKMPSFACWMSASIMLMWVFSCTLCSSFDTSISYAAYCHDTLSDAEGHQHDIRPTSTPSDKFSLSFQRAFFSGGSPLLQTSASFLASSMKLAGEQEAQKYLVEGSLLFRSRLGFWSATAFNRTRAFDQSGPRWDPFIQPEGIRLSLKGLWDARSGTLCMAGCFKQYVSGRSKNTDDCQVKAVFQYPLKNSISQPLVKAVIESKREQQDPLFFEPVAITAVSEAPYVFRKDDENAEDWPLQHANVPENFKIRNDETAVCQIPWHNQPLTVTWDKQCTGQDCSPFEDVIPGSPTTLSVENMVCAEGKIHGFFFFSHQQANASRTDYDVFAVEGAWNTSTGQLCASACYLKGGANGSLAFNSQDCDIRITLQFPTTLGLFFRYGVVGRVERRKASKFSSFKPFSFAGHWDMNYGYFEWGRSAPQMEYAYTEERITQARSQCEVSSPKHSTKGWMGKGKPRYPDGQIVSDLQFSATVKDSSGSSVKAYLSPVAINERTEMFDVFPSMATSEQKPKRMNISFDVHFFGKENGIKLLENTTFPALFPAEGVYNSKSGMLCLIACRPLTFSRAQIGSKLYDGNKDCEMLVTIQYPPVNPAYFAKHEISGQVRSLREQKDDLFFTPVSVFSTSIFYQEQAAKVLVDIDLEVVMGIISLTMAVVFIGLQLRHVKKNPKVLSHVSLVMLTVLTLGHLIPLVLMFEEIFSSRSGLDVLAWIGRGLEINEVIVGLMTMVVFLMLIRLLYLSWARKSASEGPWHMERGAVCVCLTLYALGGLIALIVYGIKGSTFLDVTKAFAGLTGDFFLFPQVVGNYFWEIQGTVLDSPFYVGMTVVRCLPHIYDILRKLEFFSLLRSRRFYYYANPSWDFYSNAWDAIIPLGNLLLAVLIFLQQRYGGACFSIGSWRKTRPNTYTKVSVNPI